MRSEKLEATDRGTLAQEFRIAGHHHVGRRIGLHEATHMQSVLRRDIHFSNHVVEALRKNITNEIATLRKILERERGLFVPEPLKS